MKAINTTAFPFAEKHRVTIPDANNPEHVIKVNFPAEEWTTCLNSNEKLTYDELLKPNPYNLAHFACINLESYEWGEFNGLPGQMFTIEKPEDSPVIDILTIWTLYIVLRMMFHAACDEELTTRHDFLCSRTHSLKIEGKSLVAMIIDISEDLLHIETHQIENTNTPNIEKHTLGEILSFVNAVSIKESFPFECLIKAMPASEKNMSIRFRHLVE